MNRNVRKLGVILYLLGIKSAEPMRNISWLTLLEERLKKRAITKELKSYEQKSKVERPLRDPDHKSKRGVPYWWAPEWVRATNSAETSFGKIVAIKEKNGEVNLYMKSKEGKPSFIQGSIQREFQQWHEDRQIDYILLGMDIDDIIKDET